ncbi:MAG: ChaN family lipoprotein [Hydrogenophaga sp.]|nr:ChaN family lipoprotein [Hydrogenophaga sp.]
MPCRLPVTPALLLALTLLGACAHQPPVPAIPDAPLVLLGEQHDADEHQRLARDAVRRLAVQGRLAALVVEMADAGRDTRGLPPQASEAQVRERLVWNSDGWPWERYGPVVMAAVQAGVPVIGGNQPRAQMRASMQDSRLDQRLDAAALDAQRQAIERGHCGLLPDSQLPAMVRIQVARDLSLAHTATSALRPGQTVLLLAGSGHVRRDLGIPRHLDPALAQQARVVWMQAGGDPVPAGQADATWATPAVPEKDHCAQLREQMGQPARR